MKMPSQRTFRSMGWIYPRLVTALISALMYHFLIVHVDGRPSTVGGVDSVVYVCSNGNISFSQGGNLWCCPGFYKDKSSCIRCSDRHFMPRWNNCDRCIQCRTCDDAEANGEHIIRVCNGTHDSMCNSNIERAELPLCANHTLISTTEKPTTAQTDISSNPQTESPDLTGHNSKWWPFLILAIIIIIIIIIISGFCYFVKKK